MTILLNKLLIDQNEEKKFIAQLQLLLNHYAMLEERFYQFCLFPPLISSGFPAPGNTIVKAVGASIRSGLFQKDRPFCLDVWSRGKAISYRSIIAFSSKENSIKKNLMKQKTGHYCKAENGTNFGITNNAFFSFSGADPGELQRSNRRSVGELQNDLPVNNRGSFSIKNNSLLPEVEYGQVRTGRTLLFKLKTN